MLRFCNKKQQKQQFGQNLTEARELNFCPKNMVWGLNERSKAPLHSFDKKNFFKVILKDICAIEHATETAFL